METKIFITDLKEGLSLESIFLCSQKSLLTDKNGKPYIKLSLSDRTGTIEARIWDKAPLMTQNFNRLDYVWVKGNVVRFQNNLQFNVIAINQVPEEKINPTDFIAHTKKDIGKMYESLLTLCRNEMKNEWVQKLILSILEDPKMGPQFKLAPAATSNHHAWIGGLLEHVLQLCQVAVDVLKHYPHINQDLVLAGLIMHDFGKIEELSWNKHLDYTDRGRLIGHLVISVQILLKKAAEIPNFPPTILQQIEHIILSHHGQLDYGSPKEPMTLEALMVHHLDNMDSKLQAFVDVLARETDGDENWSGKNFVFGRPLYKKTAADMGEIPSSSRPNKIQEEKPKLHSKPPTKKSDFKAPLKTNLGELLSEKWKEKA